MSKQRDLVHGQLTDVPESLAIQALNDRWDLATAADFASDADVLNYALTLEYLEAAFYEMGNSHNLTSGQTTTYLMAIQKDEETHVADLTAAIKQIGATPVAKPGVNFDGVFASQASFLGASYTFENLGVSAYLGAAGYIKNKTLLQAAAGIFGVEARHAAIVANILNKPAEGGVYMGAFETPKSKATVLAAAQPFIAQMSQMPTGSVNTGGGSTAGTENKGLFAVGGAAVLGGAGLAYLAANKRNQGSTAQPAGASADGVTQSDSTGSTD